MTDAGGIRAGLSSRALVLIAFAGWSHVAAASCTVTSAPTPVSASGYWSGGSGRGPARLVSKPVHASFSFKCTSDTTYSVVLNQGVGQPKGFIEVSRDGISEILAEVFLRSVGGDPVNQPFAKLPVDGYQGRAVAGRTYEVSVDLMPVGSARSTKTIRNGTLTGSALVELRY